ncbi:MAG: hypothetical protein P8011_00480 [Acidihalobacter sp.]|uniref:hypothetical protein n=1 Tax=Acidihalobacter sp. TaxID=1872108 RepID=UPI00307DF5E1
MGGYGSGRRWYTSTTDTTNDYRAIDVRRWHREGLLEPGQAFRWRWSRNGETTASINVRAEPGRVVLDYRHREHGGEWRDEALPVDLTWTACNYGGERPWFRCPNCGRRVAILYGGGIFACRHCYRLTYQSQRESLDDRLTRRIECIRARLDWEPGFLNGNGLKPKGMQWRTFWRLHAEHEALVAQSVAWIAERFGFEP